MSVTLRAECHSSPGEPLLACHPFIFQAFPPMSEARGTHAAFFVASVAGSTHGLFLGENCLSTDCTDIAVV